MSNPASETHFLKKITFIQGVQVLEQICRQLNNNGIDTILFGKWAAALYTLELTNMGPYVLLVPQLYLHDKKAELDKYLSDINFIASKSHKFIYEKDDHRLILESQAILATESQIKRNTVWREFSDLIFKTRSASSILSDYEEANKPEHDEIRKKIKAFLDSRKFITKLSKNIIFESSNAQSNGTSTKKETVEPVNLIHYIVKLVEESIYKTPSRVTNELADILQFSDKEQEEMRKLNAKRTLFFQSICERLNIQSYLLRFYDITNRFKSFVCIEILINGDWYLIDLSAYQTTIIKTKVREQDRYLNATVKSRGTDCFEINLGDIEQEMHGNDESGDTILLPKFS